MKLRVVLVLTALAAFFLTTTAQQVTFSSPRGFYNAPLQLTLTTDVGGGTIKYTLDGSVPSSGAGTTYSTPISINKTTVVRAMAFAGTTTPVFTNTYLFLDSVIHQPRNIPGWPVNDYFLGDGSASAPQDYEMDPDVVNNPAYSGQIIDALKQIPSISVVMDKTAFFEMYDGEVERATSVEILYPNDPSKNEQFNTDIESHSHLRLKRSLQFTADNLHSDLFKYGPLNGNTAISDFKNTKIVLRGGNNDGWNRNWDPAGTTYTHDEWYRASQVAMNDGKASHGTFMHLYVDGIYWGLYNPVERPDEGFDSEYFGGKTSDWLCFNHDGIRAGDQTRYDYLMNTVLPKNQSVTANYNEFKQYVNVNEYSDYILLGWYMGMGDWPFNNYYGGNLNNPASPSIFLGWDGEWSWENIHDANAGGWVQPLFRSTGNSSTPLSKIWHSAKANPDFMTAFADRIYKQCFNQGPLTDANSRARWATVNNFIDKAVIAESARWGDALNDGTLRTKNNDWTPQVTRIDGLMNGNVARFIAALRAEGYYPTIDPPNFNKEEGNILAGFQLTMTNPNGAGTIYYTTDGTDPRLSGGGLAGTAISYSSAITLNANTTIKARVKNGSNWSALHEGFYTIYNLKVNEFLASNVANIADEFGDHEDWIEIYNNNSRAVDIGGMYLTDVLATPTKYQIPATNPTATTIPPFGFKLLFADQEMVEGILHVNIKLSNTGEQIGISVQNGATTTYLDSLTFGVQNNDVSKGRFPDGSATQRLFTFPTPGAPNVIPFISGVYINEFVASNTTGIVDELSEHDDWIELYNSNSGPVNIGGLYLTNNLSNLTMWQFPVGTTVQAKGYLLLWADNQPAQGSFHLNFTLSNTNGQLGLTQILSPDQKIIDSLSYGAQTANVSRGRYPDGGALRSFISPTPGAPNVILFTKGIKINEFMAKNVNGSADEFGEKNDWIEIYNEGLQAVNIGGMYLTNNTGNLTLWKIPTTNAALTTIPVGGFLRFWADNQTAQGVLHAGFTLNDAFGKIAITEFVGIDSKTLDSLSYTNQTADVSRGLYPDGSSVYLSFTSPTPGASNVLPVITGLYINEFDAANNTGTKDENGEEDDWFEIYNSNSTAVSLAGLYVTDNLSNPTKYHIPSNVPGNITVPAKGFILLWADDQAEQGVRHVGFKLSASGEQLGLIQINGTTPIYIDSLTFGPQAADVSRGRLPDGSSNFVSFNKTTAGSTNVIISDTSRVESFSLIDATSDLVLRTLNTTDTVNIAALPHTSITIRANTVPASVGSVKFSLNGNLNYKIENGGPYSLAGDNTNGTNYQAWSYSLTNYTLTATPYHNTNASGATGTPKTISFLIVNQSQQAPDCHGDAGGTATLDDCSICSGGNSGHVANSNKDACGVCFGDGSSCQGCTNKVTSFTLMHAGTAGAIGMLNNNDIINLATTGPISLRADVCGSLTKSVRFKVNGASVRIENSAPYSIAGDGTGPSYTAWNVSPGSYTVEGISYTAINGGGTAGTSYIVNITVVNQQNPTIDCNGVTGGTAHLNSCGICVGGNTGLSENQGKDCNGVCNGTAALDDCGICSGGNTGHVANSNKDACGVCFGNGSSCQGCTNKVTSFTLMHSGTAGAIGVLTNNYIINLAVTGPISVRADVCDNATKSVRFKVNGTTVRIENSAPYSIAGDGTGPSYTVWNVSPGAYTLEGTSYTSTNAGGTAGTPYSINITVINQQNPTTDCNGVLNGTAMPDDCGICSGGNTGHVANSNKDACGVCFGNGSSCGGCTTLQISGVTIVKAGNTTGDIGLLTEGMVLNKTALGSFSMRADVCGGTAGSVKFFVNGILTRTENGAPYSLNGDANGKYTAWNPGPGAYTLLVTPYPGSNGQGTAGISKTIHFTVVNSASKLDEEAFASDVSSFSIYPNPNNGNFTVQASSPVQADLTLRVFNSIGKEVYNVTEIGISGDYSRPLQLQQAIPGLYIVEMVWGEQTVRQKLVVR